MRLSDSTIERFSWQQEALCAREGTPEAYFPETAPQRGLKDRCNERCQVREQCLAFALATDAVGIWGGTSTKERRKLKRRERRLAS